MKVINGILTAVIKLSIASTFVIATMISIAFVLSFTISFIDGYRSYNIMEGAASFLSLMWLVVCGVCIYRGIYKSESN